MGEGGGAAGMTVFRFGKRKGQEVSRAGIHLFSGDVENMTPLYFLVRHFKEAPPPRLEAAARPP